MFYGVAHVARALLRGTRLRRRSARACCSPCGASRRSRPRCSCPRWPSGGGGGGSGPASRCCAGWPARSARCSCRCRRCVGPWVWAALMGVGVGAGLPAGARRDRLAHPGRRASAATSGLALGVGYTAAGLGPLLMGVLIDVTGGYAAGDRGAARRAAWCRGWAILAIGDPELDLARCGRRRAPRPPATPRRFSSARWISRSTSRPATNTVCAARRPGPRAAPGCAARRRTRPGGRRAPPAAPRWPRAAASRPCRSGCRAATVRRARPCSAPACPGCAARAAPRRPGRRPPCSTARAQLARLRPDEVDERGLARVAGRGRRQRCADRVGEPFQQREVAGRGERLEHGRARRRPFALQRAEQRRARGLARRRAGSRSPGAAGAASRRGRAPGRARRRASPARPAGRRPSSRPAAAGRPSGSRASAAPRPASGGGPRCPRRCGCRARARAAPAAAGPATLGRGRRASPRDRRSPARTAEAVGCGATDTSS